MKKKSTLAYLNMAAQAIYDKKGYNILGLDVREISSMTDYYIIAEGSVGRHVAALARSIVAALKEEGLSPAYIEGERTGDWVVIDYIDFIIHLLEPDMREKYRLEEIWRSGKIVDLEITVGKES